MVVRAHCPDMDSLTAGPGTSGTAAACTPEPQYSTASPSREQHGTAARQYYGTAVGQYVDLPVHEQFLPGTADRQKNPDWITSDAMLLFKPGLEVRCRTDDLLDMLLGAFDALGPDGSNAQGQVNSQLQQQRPGLLPWSMAARDVLLGLLQEDVVVEVPGEIDFEGLLLCIVRLAKLSVQVHHLLLRGDLRMHEKIGSGL